MAYVPPKKKMRKPEIETVFHFRDKNRIEIRLIVTQLDNGSCSIRSDGDFFMSEDDLWHYMHGKGFEQYFGPWRSRPKEENPLCGKKNKS